MNRTLFRANGIGAVSAAVLLATTSVVIAQEVRLTSPDGSIDMVGELLDYTDDVYVLKTSLGELRIKDDNLICSGTGCPIVEEGLADIRIIGSETVGRGPLPLVIAGYAGTL